MSANIEHRKPKHKTYPGLIWSVILISCFLPGDQTVAAPFSHSWPIKELAKSSNAQVVLRNKNGGILKRINTNQLRYLYAVKTSIETAAETEAEFLLVDGEQPNAFAGFIRGHGKAIGVNFAMLELLGLDVHAMAALIGHEIAHLRLEHGEKSVKRRWGFTLLKVLGTAILDDVGVSNSDLISNLTFTIIETKYSRDNEREADYLGMIWSIEAGYEPDGGVRLFEELNKISHIRPLPFLSTHPSPPERIKTMQKMSQRLSK